MKMKTWLPHATQDSILVFFSAIFKKPWQKRTGERNVCLCVFRREHVFSPFALLCKFCSHCLSLSLSLPHFVRSPPLSLSLSGLCSFLFFIAKLFASLRYERICVRVTLRGLSLRDSVRALLSLQLFRGCDCDCDSTTPRVVVVWFVAFVVRRK